MNIKSYISSLRVGEALLMTGFSFAGVIFIPKDVLMNAFHALPLVILCVCFYVIAIYALNSAAGYEHDKLSERLNHVSTVSRGNYNLLFLFTIGVTLSIGYVLNWQIALSCVLGVIVWASYYLPPLSLKSSTWGGSLAHIVGGIVHFQMGYSAFLPVGRESLAISVYFGFLLATGHVNHMMIDLKADKQANLSTAAVVLGKHQSKRLRTMFALAGIVVLSILFNLGILPLKEFVPLLIASTIISISSSIKIVETKSFQTISRLSVMAACLYLVWENYV